MLAEEWENAFQPQKKSLPAECLSNVMHCVAKVDFRFNACSCLHCTQCCLIPATKYLHLKSLNVFFAVVVWFLWICRELADKSAASVPSFSLHVDVVMCEYSWREKILMYKKSSQPTEEMLHIFYNCIHHGRTDELDKFKRGALSGRKQEKVEAYIKLFPNCQIK